MKTNNNNDVSTLAGRLAWMRRTSGLTLRQLAEKTGISFSGLSMIERGERSRIAYDTARRLAQAYRVDLVWLMSGKGRSPTERELIDAGNRP